MPRPDSSPAARPVAWALLSQALWLPLLAVDLQDRWSSRMQDLTPRPGAAPLATAALPGPSAAGASLGPLRTPSASSLVQPGLLLGSRPSGQPLLGAAVSGAPPFPVRSTPDGGAAAFPPPAAPASGSPAGRAPGELAFLADSPGQASQALRRAGFNRAELLGGTITLDDLQEATIPPMALAERGRLSLAGDPLAALPEAWREPMRQALASLPSPTGSGARVGQARHVHVPSTRISRPTEVPLALQPDGSVDILSRPESEAVLEDIRDWSARQAPPAEGSIAPALVHLHPVSEAAPLRPTPADLSEPASAPAPAPPAEPTPAAASMVR